MRTRFSRAGSTNLFFGLFCYCFLGMANLFAATVDTPKNLHFLEQELGESWSITSWVWGVFAIGVLLGLIPLWKKRTELLKTCTYYRQSIFDSLTSAGALTILWFGYGKNHPEIDLSHFEIGFCLLGYWRLLAWAIGTVRGSGWLPGKPVWHNLLSLLLLPILLVPVVIRNAFKAAEHFGLIVFLGEILGATIYFYPEVSVAFLVLPIMVLLAAGAVRLFAYTFKFINETWFGHNKWVAALLSDVFWPITVAYGLFFLALFVLTTLLGRWWLIALFAIGGAFFDFAGPGALIGALAAVLPLLFGVGMMGITPTGYGNVDFGSNFDDSSASDMSLGAGSLDFGGGRLQNGGEVRREDNYLG